TRKAARAARRDKDRPRLGPESPAPEASPPLDARWVALLLLGAVLLAYSPAIDGYFLWDDDAHVTRPDLRSWHGLWRIWFDLGATQQYYPLLHTAFWLEHRLWGNAPAAYHLVNVLLHAASAGLLLLILRRLEVPG